MKALWAFQWVKGPQTRHSEGGYKNGSQKTSLQELRVTPEGKEAAASEITQRRERLCSCPCWGRRGAYLSSREGGGQTLEEREEKV